ncbi:Endoribonuclease [Aphelenchoides besseyi]|nr:Endoribonuclease [Aphelenchoides besseyi]
MKALLFVCVFILLSTAYASVQSIVTIPHVAADFQRLVDEMRAADQDRPGYCDVQLNYQNKYDAVNFPSHKLFEKVDDNLLKRPIYKKLLNLRKFYNPQAGIKELQSLAKETAINSFYEEIWWSGPFQKLMTFLHAHGHPWATNMNVFNTAIRSIWFDEFARNKATLNLIDTSGVVMHNMQETPTDVFEYQGYYDKLYDVIAKTNIKWRTLEKKEGSYLVNSSPAFDFALFTACALMPGPQNKCRVVYRGCTIDIKVSERSVKRSSGIKNMYINSVFPIPADTQSGTCQTTHEENQLCCLLGNMDGIFS